MLRFGVRWRVVALSVVAMFTAVTGLSGGPASADQAVTVGVGTSVVSGLFHTCVIMQDSTVKCWGSNENGQIGENGTTGSQAAAFNPTPVVAFSSPTAASIATGGRHTCALNTNGTVACFGKNDFGQLGLDPNTFPDRQTPTAVAGLSNVTSISAGDVFSCATKADGTVWCWGVDALGQLGVPTTGLPTISTPPAPYSFTPVQVVGVTGAIAVDAGDNHACALRTDGNVMCWGANDVGQLGNGTMGGSSTVAAVVGGLDRIAGLTSGRSHSCARKTSGTVFCWGANDSGQLGVGDTTPRLVPEVLPTLGAVRTIAASEDTTCAVRTTGTAACWGANGHGQLGNGTKTTSLAPSTVSNLTNAAVIAPGWNHTCALLTDGSMKCWGANDRGQLGNGTGGLPTDPDATTPQVVPGLTAVKLDVGTVTNPGPNPAPVVLDQPYVALAAPERLLDTRPFVEDVLDANPAYQGIGPVGPGGLELVVTGRGTTPAGVASVFLNVTAVNAPASGYLTVYPCGAGRPTASNVNYGAGDTVANAVIAKVGTGNKVCIFAETPVNVIVDIAGYFPSTDSYTPLAAPIRILESRPGAEPTVDGQSSNFGRIADGSITRLSIAGRGGSTLPGSVASVALNVTAINGGDNGGYLTVWPCDASRPDASNVNYARSQTIPNLVVSKVSIAGEVCIYNYKAVDLAIDASGYFATTISYTPLAAPARFMDIRLGGSTIDGVAAGPVSGTVTGGGDPYRLLVGGRGGISTSAGAVLTTVTVVNPAADGYLSVFPCGQATPTVSNINYKAGQTIANTVAAGIGADKKVCIFSSANADVLVDVAGTLS